ncbi:T9SS type A sorting domain-containing protein [bacterium]|nr:MAG: T9SS type A sorting domain-containing protein [bacterium]
MQKMIHSLLFLCLLTMFAVPVFAQTQVVVPITKSTPSQNASITDSLQFSNGNAPYYYGYQFGRNLTLSYPLSAISSDSIAVFSLKVPFYGGRTDTSHELYSAKIRAYIWDKVDTTFHFQTKAFKRVSALVDVSVSAEQIKWVSFAFTDTSGFKNENLWIGINYENDNDSLESVSPVFSSSPELYNAIYQRTIRIDTITVDSIRYRHSEFWQSPSIIGGMNAYLEYERIGTEKEVTSIHDLIDTTPQVYAIKAYPNPFNPETIIQFRSIQTGTASVKIYSAIGLQVAGFNVDTIKDNEYKLKWDASSLASGVYVIMLNQNNSLRVNKVTLVK